MTKPLAGSLSIMALIVVAIVFFIQAGADGNPGRENEQPATANRVEPESPKPNYPINRLAENSNSTADIATKKKKKADPAQSSSSKNLVDLLTSTHAKLRSGLLKLSRTFPQLRSTNRGPLEKQLAIDEHPGWVSLWLGHFPKGPGKSNGTTNPVPKND